MRKLNCSEVTNAVLMLTGVGSVRGVSRLADLPWNTAKKVLAPKPGEFCRLRAAHQVYRAIFLAYQAKRPTLSGGSIYLVERWLAGYFWLFHPCSETMKKKLAYHVRAPIVKAEARNFVKRGGDLNADK